MREKLFIFVESFLIAAILLVVIVLFLSPASPLR